jgi:hypothetical protein
VCIRRLRLLFVFCSVSVVLYIYPGSRSFLWSCGSRGLWELGIVLNSEPLFVGIGRDRLVFNA